MKHKHLYKKPTLAGNITVAKDADDWPTWYSAGNFNHGGATQCANCPPQGWYFGWSTTRTIRTGSEADAYTSEEEDTPGHTHTYTRVREGAQGSGPEHIAAWGASGDLGVCANGHQFCQRGNSFTDGVMTGYIAPDVGSYYTEDAATGARVASGANHYHAYSAHIAYIRYFATGYEDCGVVHTDHDRCKCTVIGPYTVLRSIAQSLDSGLDELVTTTYPSDTMARVSSIHRVYHPGLYRMEVALGDLGFDVDVAEAAIKKIIGEVKEPEIPVEEKLLPAPLDAVITKLNQLEARVLADYPTEPATTPTSTVASTKSAIEKLTDFFANLFSSWK